MRIIPHPEYIFDTQLDTKKIFVPMKYHFVLRDYTNAEGKSPLQLHITQKGKRGRIPIDIQIEKKHWDKEKQRVRSNCPAYMDLNLMLESLEARITGIKVNFHLTKTFLSIEKFRDEFLNGIPRTDFITFYGYALEKDKPEMNPNSYKKQKSVHKALKEFRPKIEFHEVDLEFIRKFKMHRISQGMQSSSINSNIAIIKKFLNQAKAAGIQFPLETRSIKVGSTNGNREFLQDQELEKLKKYVNNENMQMNHRLPLGLFLFSCYTGLRISDALLLNKKYISGDYLKFTALKTGKLHKIMLTASAKNVLEAFPEILLKKTTDVDINRKLKDICRNVGINKKVTFHYGRHTFATRFLAKGGKVEVLQKILGHSSIRETMIYVHVLQEQEDEQIMLMDIA